MPRQNCQGETTDAEGPSECLGVGVGVGWELPDHNTRLQVSMCGTYNLLHILVNTDREMDKQTHSF